MTKQRSALHIETPIEDAEEISLDRPEAGRGHFIMQVEFSREELAVLRQAIGRGPGMVRFVKAAALDTAARKIEKNENSDLRAAD